MNLSELMGHLRCSVLRDEAKPYLWTDTELLRYLNEAEAQFARKTHILSDDESDFTTITTTAGQGSYTLDERIVYVAEVWLEVDDGNGNLHAEPMRDHTRQQLKWRYTQGKPLCYNQQTRRNTLRFYPVPDDVYTVRMVVARKPLKALVNGKDEPEIDDEYQLSLCDYAAWRALTNNDPERAQMSPAREFQANWDLMIRDVKRDMARERSGAHPRARANWTGKRWGSYY